MTDKRTPDELPAWLYTVSPDAVEKRDEWRRLIAADKERVRPIQAEAARISRAIVEKTIVTGPAGNPDGRVPRDGVTHAEVDKLVRRQAEVTASMAPDRRIAALERELRELVAETYETVDMRDVSARAVREAHQRMQDAVAAFRAAYRDRQEGHAAWIRASGAGGYSTVGGESYHLRLLEAEEIRGYRSGALTDGLDEAAA